MFQSHTHKYRVARQTISVSKVMGGRSVADHLLRLVPGAAIVLVLAMAMVTGSAQANTGPTPDSAPDSLVENTTAQLIEALKKDRELITAQPAHVYALANEIVLPHFDFERMSALALGKHWRRATAAQKQRFPQEFRALLMRTYATALNEFTDETIVMLPLRDDPDSGDVTVHTEIQRAAGPAIPVSYRLYEQDGTWKVYDIKIEGISLVANYRSSFSSQVRRHGLDGLIDMLAKRNANSASVVTLKQ
jgi:phospholipid transport system substrate-binding protein